MISSVKKLRGSYLWFISFIDILISDLFLILQVTRIKFRKRNNNCLFIVSLYNQLIWFFFGKIIDFFFQKLYLGRPWDKLCKCSCWLAPLVQNYRGFELSWKQCRHWQERFFIPHLPVPCNSRKITNYCRLSSVCLKTSIQWTAGLLLRIFAINVKERCT